jgi:antibiotic biosynthesis monooxygenase (ABM) superfamily enzyme
MSTAETELQRGRRLARDEPAIAVFSWRARPGRETELAAWLEEARQVLARFPGYLGSTVIQEEGSRNFHLIVEFTNQEDLRRWLQSDERAVLLARTRSLAAAQPAVQLRTGLETWFQVPSHDGGATLRPPPRWKMWLVSLAAIYPLVLLFMAFVAPRLQSWPLWARAAFLPFVLLTSMTYVVMPVVTRVLHRWLSPGG